MRFTRVRDLAGYAAAALLITWPVVRQVYGSLPPFPVVLPVSLGILAAVEAAYGTQLRARIQRRPGTARVPPLVAARAVALAKASSIVGAVAVGSWGGLLAHTLPQVGFLAAAGPDTVTGAVGVACGAGLAAAGLWLEHCCRTPGRPEDERGEPAAAPRRPQRRRSPGFG